MSTTPAGETLHHHSRRMGGRDPHEAHRAATPLELLFDLTFVVSFGLAASQLAHALAEGHYDVALLDKIVYAGTMSRSFERASRDLWKLAEVDVPTKQVERVCQRIGEERVRERQLPGDPDQQRQPDRGHHRRHREQRRLQPEALQVQRQRRQHDDHDDRDGEPRHG